MVFLSSLLLLNYCSTLSKRDRLSVPKEWTPLRRNTTYGLSVAKNPSSLMSFFLFFRQLFFFCLCLAPHSCTFSSSFTSQLFCPALPLPKSCWAFPLQVPLPAYFLSHPSTLSSLLHFLIPYFPSFPYFSCLSRTSHVCLALPLPKPCWACSLQVPPSAYFLFFPFTQFPPVLPCIVDFILTCGLWILPVLCP